MPSAVASERVRAPDLSRHRQTTKEIGTMATNLVSSVMQFLTPDMVAKIARTLGIDPDVAQKVVSAAVPAILASFAGLAAKPAGAQQLSRNARTAASRHALADNRRDRRTGSKGHRRYRLQPAFDTPRRQRTEWARIRRQQLCGHQSKRRQDGARADRSHGHGCAWAAATQRRPGRKRPRQSSLLAERSDYCRHAVRPRQHDGRTRYARCS